MAFRELRLPYLQAQIYYCERTNAFMADGYRVSLSLFTKLVALEDGILFEFEITESTRGWRCTHRIDGEQVSANICRQVRDALKDRRLLRPNPRELCQAMGCNNPLPEGRRKFCSDQCATRQRVHEHRERQKLATI